MCGLAFAATKKGAKGIGQRVYNLYKKQDKRGKSGFGYIAIKDSKMINLYRSTGEEGMRKAIMEQEADMLLLHHRFPTSTPNTLGTTHPIFVSNDELKFDYYIMHNGTISNDDFLKEKHNKIGYKYTTEYVEELYHSYNGGVAEYIETSKGKYNDSECMAIELARFIEGKEDKVNIVGAAAIMGVRLVKGTKDVTDVFYGQNFGRSLGRRDKKGWITIASETGKEVEQMKLFHINPDTLETNKVDLEMDEAIKKAGSDWPSNMGFNNHNVNVRTIEDTGPDLVNAMYTYDEAVESGAPFSDFFSCARVKIEGKYEQCYAPIIFTGATGDRPLFSDAYYYPEEDIQMLPTPDDYEPEEDVQRETLEDCAMQHGRYQYQMNHLDDAFESGKVGKHIYDKRCKILQSKLNELQSQMSDLGFDSEEVEKVVDLAWEMVDYEYSNR